MNMHFIKILSFLTIPWGNKRRELKRNLIWARNDSNVNVIFHKRCMKLSKTIGKKCFFHYWVWKKIALSITGCLQRNFQLAQASIYFILKMWIINTENANFELNKLNTSIEGCDARRNWKQLDYKRLQNA